MATATRTQVTKEVVTQVQEIVVVLELTQTEANHVRSALGSIGQSGGVGTTSRANRSVYDALYEVTEFTPRFGRRQSRVLQGLTLVVSLYRRTSMDTQAVSLTDVQFEHHAFSAQDRLMTDLAEGQERAIERVHAQLEERDWYRGLIEFAAGIYEHHVPSAENPALIGQYVLDELERRTYAMGEAFVNDQEKRARAG